MVDLEAAAALGDITLYIDIALEISSVVRCGG
jgi:hypothetical protein